VSEVDPRDARIVQLEAEVAELKKQLAEALATIAELRAQVGQNSRNSNKPPSSDGPGVKRERKEPTGRKPGGQPEVKPRVTEYQPCYGHCARCAIWTQAELPQGVPSGAFGPRLTAVVALLTGRLRLTKRLVQECLSSVLGVEVALWTFVHMEEVEPTNNRAERALRPAVCMRKGSFGTHSPEGSRYIERMLTAVTTLKQQRNVLDYLTEAMHAHLHGQAAPSLLPVS
jgi:uncharacterized protein DUF6444/transposase IS66 family protein